MRKKGKREWKKQEEGGSDRGVPGGTEYVRRGKKLLTPSDWTEGRIAGQAACAAMYSLSRSVRDGYSEDAELHDCGYLALLISASFKPLSASTS